MESDTGVSCEFYKIKSTFITKQYTEENFISFNVEISLKGNH